MATAVVSEPPRPSVVMSSSLFRPWKPATTTTKLTDRNTTLTLAYTKKTYNGGTLKPAVTVKHGSKTLTHGEDYTVSYHHNSEPGTATAKITGTGKVKHVGSAMRHNLEHKSARKRRELSADDVLRGGQAKKLHQLLQK